MTVLVRLMWKEYRVLRSFWLALAIFGLACDALIFVFVANPQERLPGMFAFAGILPAGFALGAGAMLFALEREEATREFLRFIPITASRIFASKVLTAWLGTLLLALLLVAVTRNLAGQTSRPNPDDMFLGVVDMTLLYSVMVLQAMGWSVFFSLRSARPLLAALLGALGTVSCIGLVHAVTERSGLQWSWSLRSSWALPSLHLAAAAAVWSVNVWLGSRWLHGRRPVERTRLNDMDWSSAPRRLLWQQWRRSYRMLAVLVFLGLLLPGLIWPAFIPATGLVFALAGACTFLADQEGRQFRFFAERGVAARRVWISRQMFWAGSALALAAPLFIVHCMAIKFFIPQLPDNDRYLWTRLGWVFELGGYAIWIGLAFGAGQLCSMFFRSGILAAALGVVLAGLLLGWAVLMHTLAIGLWWSVAPLIVALFAATWLRSNGWILERNHVRAWLTPLLVLAVPVLGLTVAVPIYRVYEIPDTGAVLSIEAPAPRGVEANEATRQFLLACERLPMRPEQNGLVPLSDPTNAEPTGREQQWLKENEAALNEVLSALGQLPADATLRGSLVGINWRQLVAMIIRSGQTVESEEKLAEAWQRYQSILQLARFLRVGGPAWGEVVGGDLEKAVLTQLPRWGARKGQSIEGVRAALDDVGQLERYDQPLADVVRRDYADILDALKRMQTNPDEWGHDATLMARWAPWEFSRARRLLKYKASLSLHAAQQLDMGLSGRAAGDMLPSLDSADVGRLSATTWPKVEVTDLTSNRRSLLCYRRGTQLALAAEVWRLEHGQLLEDLAELQGTYFEKLPVDPYTDGLFLWFPWGLRSAVRLENVSELRAGTPFVYSRGATNASEDYFAIKFDRLRRRSADDPIVRSEPSPAQGGKTLKGTFLWSKPVVPNEPSPSQGGSGMPAAGPGGPLERMGMGMPGAAGIPMTVPDAPALTVEEWAESLEGLAFPIPSE